MTVIENILIISIAIFICKKIYLKSLFFQKDIIHMNKENGGMISMFKKMKRFLKAAFTIVLCLVELIEIFADTSAKSFA